MVVSVLKVTQRHSTSKARLLRLLEEINDSGWCRLTLHLGPGSLDAERISRIAPGNELADNQLSPVLDEMGESDTGLALFVGDERIVAVGPPFPLEEDRSADGADLAPLIELLDRDYVVGVVLLRLRRYAIGVLRGEKLVATKTRSRYVKNRHRAGGTSQRRFERSRERTVRELFDKTCEVLGEVFEPYKDDLDYVLMGGERQTLLGLQDRCRALQDMRDRTLARRLHVEQPNQTALENIAFEVWKSRVVAFEEGD